MTNFSHRFYTCGIELSIGVIIFQKLRGVSTAEQKRLSKLPPRLAKAKAEELKERKQQQRMTGPLENIPANQMPASVSPQQQGNQQQSQNFIIEDWDSDLANAMPVSAETGNNGGYFGNIWPLPLPTNAIHTIKPLSPLLELSLPVYCVLYLQ